MNQAQFSELDAFICARVGISDEKEVLIWAALAMGIAQSLALTTSPQLQALALQVWG